MIPAQTDCVVRIYATTNANGLPVVRAEGPTGTALEGRFWESPPITEEDLEILDPDGAYIRATRQVAGQVVGDLYQE